jgi:hypothetical protein
MVAGIAAADGHATITWTGAVTAGVAREGSAAATAAVAGIAAGTEATAWKGAGVFGSRAAAVVTVGTNQVLAANAMVGATATAAEAVQMRNAADYAILVARTGRQDGTGTLAGGALAAAEAAYATRTAELNYVLGTAAVAKADAGNFKAYSEINTTVTGNVTAGGMTLSAGMSVDAGTGYDFADDDGFDAAKGTGSVGLDSVSLDMGSAGKITLNDNAITHMVDADDDAAGDVSYSNTFGGASFTAVLDLEKDDSDVAAANAVSGRVALAADVAAATATAAAVTLGSWIPGTAAVAADTQWSAKVSMPLGAGSVYVAMDEESGNAFGGSAVVSGATVSIDSKLEALESDLKANRSNTLGVSYTMGSVTAGATYNSIKDGDQWGVSASYAAGDMTVGFSTDEGSDWSVTGAYALGGASTGASIKAGVNYTEDAFLGLSFAF